MCLFVLARARVKRDAHATKWALRSRQAVLYFTFFSSYSVSYSLFFFSSFLYYSEFLVSRVFCTSVSHACAYAPRRASYACKPRERLSASCTSGSVAFLFAIPSIRNGDRNKNCSGLRGDFLKVRSRWQTRSTREHARVDSRQRGRRSKKRFPLPPQNRRVSFNLSSPYISRSLILPLSLSLALSHTHTHRQTIILFFLSVTLILILSGLRRVHSTLAASPLAYTRVRQGLSP